MKSKLNFFFLCWRKKRLFLMEWRGCRSNKRNKFLLIYALVGYRFWPQPLQQNNSFLPLSANFNFFNCWLMGCPSCRLQKERRSKADGMEFNHKDWMEWSSAALEGRQPITHLFMKRRQPFTPQSANQTHSKAGLPAPAAFDWIWVVGFPWLAAAAWAALVPRSFRFIHAALASLI